MALTPRIKRRISKDYSEEDREVVEEILIEVLDSLDRRADKERVAAAIILYGQGQVDRILAVAQVAGEDWRDALVAGGLAHSDWFDRLNAEFGPE